MKLYQFYSHNSPSFKQHKSTIIGFCVVPTLILFAGISRLCVVIIVYVIDNFNKNIFDTFFFLIPDFVLCLIIQVMQILLIKQHDNYDKRYGPLIDESLKIMLFTDEEFRDSFESLTI
ncbi:Hypothetical_protein [Hexamita inflata]|uniref:Hypothetical_protein n=1 Tax=Hexamita inflata TaxID=28002 RepID=A0AA86NEB9_9EUKA|nr:Hypothetical protein HINF_LOCUS5619 [Hexamita inflata]